MLSTSLNHVLMVHSSRSTNLTLTIDLKVGFYYHPPVTNEETEVQVTSVLAPLGGSVLAVTQTPSGNTSQQREPPGLSCTAVTPAASPCLPPHLC